MIRNVTSKREKGYANIRKLPKLRIKRPIET